MITVKHVGDIDYILYSFKSADWASVHGIYFVNPASEREFIRRLRAIGLSSVA